MNGQEVPRSKISVTGVAYCVVFDHRVRPREQIIVLEVCLGVCVSGLQIAKSPGSNKISDRLYEFSPAPVYHQTS